MSTIYIVLVVIYSVFAVFSVAQVSDKSSAYFAIYGFKASKNILIAVLLTLMAVIAGSYVYFAPDVAVKSFSPRTEAPSDANPNIIKAEPSAEDIFKAWDEVRPSDDIVLLTNFAVKFPDSPFTRDAWKRISEIVNAGGLKVASLDDNIGFIGTILTHKDTTLPTLTPILEQIVRSRDLESKYPLGFAIFYADGHKVFNYGVQKQSGNITFDPSALTVELKDKLVCLHKLPVRINGEIMSNITNVCFGGSGSVIHAVRFGDVAALDIEPLGASAQGLAWVIGMKRP